MTKERPQRPSADLTRQKILKAAEKLFMQHGFAGTSMSKLAEKAGVNQTLIFHHFIDKKNLWQQVKAHIIAQAKVDPIDLQPKNLEKFLTEALQQRVSIYSQCPQLHKLVSWQRMESPVHQKKLSGIPNHVLSPVNWLTAIKFLQQHHHLNSHLKPELIMIWLAASIDGMLADDLGLFKNNLQNQKHYIEMLINTLKKGLNI